MSEARTSKGFAAAGSSGAAPASTENERAQHRKYSVLVWPNLVCLDAPLVAIAWQWLFARSLGVPLSFQGTVALFLTAWLIYLGDRLGDSLTIELAASTSLRQRFCVQHRKGWLAAISFLAIADLLVIWRGLSAQQLRFGFAVGGCAAVYLVVNRWAPSFWRILPLKELSIGYLFAVGTMVPLAGGSLTKAASAPWLLFATLCALNCISIAIWERYLDVAQQRISIATEFPVVTRLFVPTAMILCAACAISAVKAARFNAPYGCIATSALLLCILHVNRTRIAADTRSALADLVLLTPLGVALAVFARG